MNWFSDYKRQYKPNNTLTLSSTNLKTLHLKQSNPKLHLTNILNNKLELTAGTNFTHSDLLNYEVNQGEVQPTFLENSTTCLSEMSLNVNNRPGFLAIKYPLEKFHSSNQDTYMVHRPTVQEGQWVEKGDILADNSSSQQGELAIGQNILVGYTPWEGYNFEDAVLLSQRLIHDELYTSLHIERYEVEVRDTQFGMEQITAQLPMKSTNVDYLDDQGIVKIGTWVQAGDTLVGKITPIDQKPLTPYEKLLYDILEKKVPKTRNTSLRVPKNVSGRVIHVEIIEIETLDQLNQSAKSNKLLFPFKKLQMNDDPILATLLKSSLSEEQLSAAMNSLKINKAVRNSTFSNKCKLLQRQTVQLKENELKLDLKSLLANQVTQENFDSSTLLDSQFALKMERSNGNKQRQKAKIKKVGQSSGPLKIHVYLAEKRIIQVGDKIAGRHGNKGIISNILPVQDMPYLPDGTPLDLVLNPLGVPSRMNVGQIFECLLGLAGSYLGQNYKIQPLMNFMVVKLHVV
jgi:DNA-directed RNA polymerase subunit beta